MHIHIRYTHATSLQCPMTKSLQIEIRMRCDIVKYSMPRRVRATTVKRATGTANPLLVFHCSLFGREVCRKFLFITRLICEKNVVVVCESIIAPRPLPAITHCFLQRTSRGPGRAGLSSRRHHPLCVLVSRGEHIERAHYNATNGGSHAFVRSAIRCWRSGQAEKLGGVVAGL